MKKISRRTFIRKSAAVGASSILGGTLLTHCGKKAPSGLAKRTDIDISVVQGDNYFENAVKAVKKLGGMNAFMPRDARVAILANPQKNNPGAFTKPEIVRAAIHMCKEAGAKEIACISWQLETSWENTGIKKVLDEEGTKLIVTDRKDESLFKPVPVPNGKALTEARIMNTLFDFDFLIDMPITKDHAGNKFTGTMKNLMGINSPQNNRTFHKKNWTTDPNAITHLEQCIADLNTVVTPDLCIVDATEFIITNGPFGPGELIKPMKVIAGTDRVALDAYCCTLWGLKPEDIIVIGKAYEHGLGEMDLEKVTIKEMKA
ncbi:DUF362 domain-containing protein [bacterium]